MFKADVTPLLTVLQNRGFAKKILFFFPVIYLNFIDNKIHSAITSKK